MSQVPRHKVFVSYHHDNDQEYRDRFEKLFVSVYDIMNSRSVEMGDIPGGLKLDEISRRIRDGYLSNSTVTVVLIGRDTWRRKHVDWEIAATIRDTDANQRSGLVGVFLPTHPSFNKHSYNQYTIPPRLYYNVECGFAELHGWSESPNDVARWIDNAYKHRKSGAPDNSFVKFARNWNGPRWYPQKRSAQSGG